MKNESLNLQKIKQFQIYSIFPLFIIAIICHFMCDWFGKRYLLALFFPINNCVWEHGKMAITSMIIWSLIEYHYLKPNNLLYYISVKSYVIIYSLIFEYSFYYTYKGIIGRGYIFMDILDSFFTSLYQCYYTYQCYKYRINKKLVKLYIIFLVDVQFLFFIYTFIQPHIPFFYCTILERYGADLKF